jgi:hypothetical protein
MTPVEIRLIKKAICRSKATIAETQYNSTNRGYLLKSIALRNKSQGRLDALEVILEASEGDISALTIIAGK